MKKILRKSDGHIINPISLGILLIIYTINIFIGDYEIYLSILILGFVILFIVSKDKLVKSFIGFIFILAMVYLLNQLDELSRWLGSFYTMFVIILRIFPIWQLALAISSYSSTHLMNGIRKMGLPNKLAIAIAVFFRFLPDYKLYMKDIREALKIRNIYFIWYRPIRSFELYLVPFIYKAFQTGEVLSASLICKGIEYDCKKTSYDNLDFKLIDYIVIALSLIIMVVAIWKRF